MSSSEKQTKQTNKQTKPQHRITSYVVWETRQNGISNVLHINSAQHDLVKELYCLIILKQMTLCYNGLFFTSQAEDGRFVFPIKLNFHFRHKINDTLMYLLILFLKFTAGKRKLIFCLLV